MKKVMEEFALTVAGAEAGRPDQRREGVGVKIRSAVASDVASGTGGFSERTKRFVSRLRRMLLTH